MRYPANQFEMTAAHQAALRDVAFQRFMARSLAALPCKDWRPGAAR
jgi:hypothetical protein